MLAKSDTFPRSGDSSLATRKLQSNTLSLALVPILIAMPLIYWPKFLEGDTQPWVTVGAMISALFFWPKIHRTSKSKLVYPILAAICCFAVYIFRETDPQLLLRYGAILGTFVLLWVVAVRVGPSGVGTAVRWSVGLWFAVGLYQFIALRLGLPVEFLGRFVAERSGVASLTAEPSFYGSISVVQIMYLLSEQRARNRPFIIMAVASVLLSGSLLSYLLLLVPLMRLRISLIFGGIVILLIFTTQEVRLAESGLFNRISNIDLVSTLTDPLRIIQTDASTNLRVGHIWFTLFDSFWDSIFLKSDVSYRESYNSWAFSQGYFLYNQSDYILTSAGELVFRSGFFGFILISLIYYYVFKSKQSTQMRFEKVIFTTLCFLGPINLANPFFVFYLAQEDSQ